MKLTLVNLMLITSLFLASVDVRELQDRIITGKADEARTILNRAVATDPKNLRLLYNRAVAAYAASKFEEALVDLDLVEDSKNRELAIKAQFQKGNAQYRIGLNNLQRDVEVTMSRWRQSISEYNELLKNQPTHTDARKNQQLVRRHLRELLLHMANRNLQAAESPRSLEERITTARSAMEEFHEAAELEPQDQNAKAGEDRARELLASALAQEGERKTVAQNMVMPRANEPAIVRPDVKQIEEGVQMLEDANSLQPNNPTYEQKLEQGRDRLANALTQQAQTYLNLEPRIPRIDEKLGLLRMAMELAEKALSERPNHSAAQQTLEAIKRRLAEIHEQEGDRQEQLSQNAELEQQAQSLSQALDHFQQAADLQPQQNQLPQKAQNAQNRLEEALEKLGDRLMKSPGQQESLEQQISRTEGATQAFNELQSLKPSERTAQKAQQAADALEKLRQQLAQQGKPMPQPGQQQQPGQSQQQPQNQPEGVPMDSPPKLDMKGRNGRYQSPSMNRNLRDY
jgi:tetratricopeptide (TPR) repeat protein